MEAQTEFVILDVRTLEEFEDEWIAGAILIPDSEIADRAARELPDKEALNLVDCHSGGRSAFVSQELTDMGYTHIYDFGGILDWPCETVGKLKDNEDAWPPSIG